MSQGNVRDFGAIGDGQQLDTDALQEAIDCCRTVIVPAGTYLTGTLYLRDNTNLVIENGATLLASGNLGDYNAPDFCPVSNASTMDRTSGGHLIAAYQKKNITISGGGNIDGASHHWFNHIEEYYRNSAHEQFEMPEVRPAQMIFFAECDNVKVHDLELCNSPYWTCFFHGCTDVMVSHLRIRNPERGHNGDGIGLDCVKGAIISDCDIATSDDCITLRSCSKRLSKPMDCENITVTNCRLRTRQAGVRVGLGNGTAIRNAVFSNLIVEQATMGLILCASWYYDEGAKISNILFNNITLNALRPIVITTQCTAEPVGRGTVRNIAFSQIRGVGVYPGGITGAPGNCIEDITLSDIQLDYPDESIGAGQWGNMAPATSTAFYISHAKNVELDRMVLYRNPSWKYGMKFEDAQVTVHNCKWDEPPRLPALNQWMKDKENISWVIKAYRQ